MHTLSRPSPQIGLTGGIGSGKSTVARMLVDLGAQLVDTDAIARALTAPGGAALPSLAQAFGPDILGEDGSLDREQMRLRVFAAPDQRQRLESILHPMIGTEAAAQAAAAGMHPVVFDVPLLTESSHWRRRVDRVLVVDCREATQLDRVMARNGWQRDMVERVMAQQATRSRRRRVADAVIFNDALSLDDLAAQVKQLWAIWIGAAAAP
jgi:dephospho-CoA kinase